MPCYQEITRYINFFRNQEKDSVYLKYTVAKFKTKAKYEKVMNKKDLRMRMKMKMKEWIERINIGRKVLKLIEAFGQRVLLTLPLGKLLI